MTEMSSRGRFVWYDLMTTDPSKAEAFYTKVCGWGTQPWESPTQYTMWTANGRPMDKITESLGTKDPDMARVKRNERIAYWDRQFQMLHLYCFIHDLILL